ncbi:MAG: hypothetical protein HETSPECPRED_009184 [Heterodermia speciosa]|uniref:Uncharacterized protein n=1 Tax=Heterodermia speciosa TaxID=116794 RepID=A0A8H3IVL5_9LECA|nr:MAG: hypothetical protein HETSPECPRED_009184 [Heterodermia speciosa]
MFRSPLQTISLLRLLVLIHLGLVAAQSSSLTCYNPDGTINDIDTPCDPEAEVTHCCGGDSLCLDNKLCWEQQYANLNQGSCTDRSWSSSECFTNSEGTGAMCDIPDAYIFVCQQTGGLQFYCDTEDSIQCTNETTTPTFSVGSAYLADYRNGSSFSVSYEYFTETLTATATASASASDTTTTSSSDSSPTAQSATLTITQTVTLPLPGATGADGAGAASSLIPKAQCPSHAGEKAGIGAGVGVPLAAALAGALAFGFWERRKRRKIEDDMRGGEKDEGRGIAGGIGGQGDNGIMGRG